MQFLLFVIINFIFFIEHIFHNIILNIYFDHIHIMCLYRVFSCIAQVITYTLVKLMVEFTIHVRDTKNYSVIQDKK